MADKYQNYKDLHDQTQKKAFTCFINEKIPNLIENDLYLEVKDGIKLIKLVEALTNTKLKYNRKIKNKAQCIDNVNRVINYLKNDRKIKLVNINAIDIVEHGNHKIILALIWIIILHFFISKIRSLQLKMRKVKLNSLSTDNSTYSKAKSNLINELSTKLNRTTEQNPSNNSMESINLLTESTSIQNSKSSIEKESDLINSIDQEIQSTNYLINAKQLLIDNLNLKFDLKLKNFNRDWKDGKKVLLIIDKFKPNLKLIDEGEQFKDDYERLQFALNSAEHHLGIKKLINEDDIYQDKPDSKSLIVYFYQYLEKILDDDQHDDYLNENSNNKSSDNLIKTDNLDVKDRKGDNLNDQDRKGDNLDAKDIKDDNLDDQVEKGDNLNKENVFIDKQIESEHKLIDAKSNEFNKCDQNESDESSNKSKKIFSKPIVVNNLNKMNSNNLNEININVQIEINDFKNSNSNKLNQNLLEQISSRTKISGKINKAAQLNKMKSRKNSIKKYGFKTGDKLVNENRLNRSKNLLKCINSIDNDTFILNDTINNRAESDLIDHKLLDNSKLNQSKTTNKLFKYINELNNDSVDKFNDAFLLDKSIENRSYFSNKKYHSEGDLIDSKLLDDSKLNQSNTTNKLFKYINELNNNSMDKFNDAFIQDKSIHNSLSISNNQIDLNVKSVNDKYEIRSFKLSKFFFNEFNNKIDNQFYLDNDFNLNDKEFDYQINDQFDLYEETIGNHLDDKKYINEINFDTFNKINDEINQIDNMKKRSYLINREIKSNQYIMNEIDSNSNQSKYSQISIYNLESNDKQFYLKILIENNLSTFFKLILFFSLFIILILFLMSNLIRKFYFCKC